MHDILLNAASAIQHIPSSVYTYYVYIYISVYTYIYTHTDAYLYIVGDTYLCTIDLLIIPLYTSQSDICRMLQTVEGSRGP